MRITVRPETPADHDAVAEVNRLAFGGDTEPRLVRALREGGYVRLSMVAEVGGEVVGHVLISRLPVETAGGTVEALALAPLAVHPSFQRCGVGTRLLNEALAACRRQGHRIVAVLGHPEFYPRFGFSAKLAETLAGPFSGPAWMALELVPGALSGVVGRVVYPPPFEIVS